MCSPAHRDDVVVPVLTWTRFKQAAPPASQLHRQHAARRMSGAPPRAASSADVALLLDPLLCAAACRACPAAPPAVLARGVRPAQGRAELLWDAPRAAFAYAKATGAHLPYEHPAALAAAALAQAAGDALHALMAHATVRQDGTVELTPRTADAATTTSLRCGACGRGFAGRRSLRDHAQSAHGAGYGLAVSAVAAAAAAARRERDYATQPPPQTQPLPAPLAAARNGDVAALTALADAGWADATWCVDRHGATALLWAAGGGHLQACRLLVARCGAQPRTEAAAKDGRSALHWAARHGRLHVVAWLLRDCGCDADVATRDGTTPLHLAAWQGHVAVCALLAEASAAPKAAAAAANAFGCAAAHWAALRDDNARAMCAWLSAAGADWRARNAAGHAPLHKACARGAAVLVTWLLSPDGGGCADLADAPDADGNTPLALAAMWGSADAAAALLLHGAKPDAHAPPAGATPLAWALHMGHADVAAALRQAGADEAAAAACCLPARLGSER